MTLRHPIIFSLILFPIMLIAMTGCSGHDRPAGGEEAGLQLRLHIAQASGASRGDYFFDPATASDAEAIRTIRVVMVRVYDDMIVHNRFIRLSRADNLSEADMSFKVDFATKYRIYLIANEEGIPNPDGDDILESYGLKEGQSYPPGFLEDLEIRADAPGKPFILSETPDDLIPVPMTEVFEVTTVASPEAAEGTSAAIQEENLFVTRTASKFIFYFFRGTDVPADFDARIRSIKIYGLGDAEYLFPRDTEYEPSKYPLSTADRVITEFALPADEPTGEAVFTLPAPLPVAGLPVKPAAGDPTAGITPFAPAAYFTESKGIDGGGKFRCSVSFDGVSFNIPVTLPNLDTLPRNTFVRVLITINAHGIDMEASVEPYTEIELKPVFGL